MPISSDFCIIGGGIAALTLARRLAAGGGSVVVAERGKVGEGASFAAAGMLAPLVEARLEEREVVAFGYEALRYYPEFVRELEEQSGLAVDYRTEATLIVGTDRDQTEQLRHQFEEQRALGLPVEWLSGYECRTLEPYLAPGVPGGILSPQDHQIDNRLLLVALRRACEALPGVTILEECGDGRLEGRTFHAGERVVEASQVVIATGAHTGLLGAAVPALARAVHPIKGQILRLDQSAMPLLGRVLRSPEMYLAPKSDGTLVLGASSEDRGFDPAITAGMIFELLRSAWECVPGIYELPITETRVGFRPATADHAPMLGPSGVEGITLAMGYYRHGILFSPYAAGILAAWLLRGERSVWLDTFSPERFHETSTERTIH